MKLALLRRRFVRGGDGSSRSHLSSRPLPTPLLLRRQPSRSGIKVSVWIVAKMPPAGEGVR